MMITYQLSHTPVDPVMTFLFFFTFHSNPKAQVSAYDGGALQALLRLLTRSPSINVKKRALYGLSSLIRFFPHAQRKFFELGGLSLLSGLMRETKSDYLSIQIKSVTLVHDLLVEQVRKRFIGSSFCTHGSSFFNTSFH